MKNFFDTHPGIFWLLTLVGIGAAFYPSKKNWQAARFVWMARRIERNIETAVTDMQFAGVRMLLATFTGKFQHLPQFRDVQHALIEKLNKRASQMAWPELSSELIEVDELPTIGRYAKAKEA